MAVRTNIYWPRCKVDGCKGIQLASSELCLVHASEQERGAALKQIHKTGVIDLRGVQLNGQLLQQVLAAVTRDADDKVQIKAARFDHAIFDDDVAFHRATFDDDAWFTGATFSKTASFAGANFSGYAGFDRATFSGDAWFDRATFSSSPGFDQVTFSGNAEFNEATFSGNAPFTRPTFSN